MRSVTVLFRIFVGFLALPLLASAKSPFAGTWELKMNDLPGVDIMIEDSDGKISGVAVFYFQLRGSDGKWHVQDKYTTPMLSLKVDGKILMFELAHHKTHESPELGPNVRFRMELKGPNEAMLYEVDDHSVSVPTPAKLTRRN